MEILRKSKLPPKHTRCFISPKSQRTPPPAGETSGCMDVVGANSADGYMEVSPSTETFSSGFEVNESDNEEV